MFLPAPSISPFFYDVAETRRYFASIFDYLSGFDVTVKSLDPNTLRHLKLSVD
jgi:hypothetical protein